MFYQEHNDSAIIEIKQSNHLETIIFVTLVHIWSILVTFTMLTSETIDIMVKQAIQA